MTKRFLLFLGEDYYPKGGWNDLFGAFDNFEDARATLKGFILCEKAEWGHIVEVKTLRKIMSANQVKQNGEIIVGEAFYQGQLPTD